VITSKHHDGFAIFDSKTSDFDVMATPFKRDILKELAEACKKEGIRLCFYHSIMDWHHPDYLPRRPWEKDRSAEGADYQRYVAYMKSQLQELCSNYGEAPHVLWFDGEWESTWTHPQGIDLYNYVRSLKPNIIINNRVDNGRGGMAGMNTAEGFAGDFGTPEQEIPATGIPGVDWESCMTMNGNWGYNKADKNFKSTEVLIQNLTDIASKGGNFLLNVGPTGEGLFPQESIDRLREMGAWMKVNGESIHGSSASPFAQTAWDGRVTMKANGDQTRLYLHVFERPKDGKLTLNGCANEPSAAWLLADTGKAPLKVERKEDALVVTLPTQLPDAINTVVVLDLKGKPDIHNSPTAKLTHDIFIGEIAVPLLDEAGNADIRYTLDGSVPTSKSTLYTVPVVLKETATITARSFRGEQAISGVFQKKLTKVLAQAATEVAATASGLQYLYFEGDWEKLPDFSRMKPLKTGVLKTFDRPQRGKEGEQFGYVYQGFIKIPKDGIYSFFTSSDDGSSLWIDQKLVVDNDGLHGMREKSGTVALAAGLHEIWVRYFERTGGDDLQVHWQAEGEKKAAIPGEAMFHVQPK
ncbi:MAG: alpha-L-fucosidase, partial [Bacteroidota bacterium]